jgi:hypothetical protein
MSNHRLSRNHLFIRLSPEAAAIILGGLKTIAAVLQSQTANWLLGHQPQARHEPPDVSNGIQRCVQQLIAVFSTLSSCRSGGRLRGATSFQLASCAFAVRFVSRRVRKGRQQAPVANFEIRCRRLLKRLEAARKRSKRAEIRQFGQQAYRQQTRHWKTFLRLIKKYLVERLTSRKPRSYADVWRRRNRIQLERFMQLTTEELGRRGEILPPETVLRKYVRLAVRYVRRGRTMFGVRTLLDNDGFAANHLADFVTIRWKKLTERKDRNNEFGT